MTKREIEHTLEDVIEEKRLSLRRSSKEDAITGQRSRIAEQLRSLEALLRLVQAREFEVHP